MNNRYPALHSPAVSALPAGFAAFAKGKNAKRELSFFPFAARVADEPEELKGGKPAGQIRDGVPKNGAKPRNLQL
jgi:hypothetical protein